MPSRGVVPGDMFRANDEWNDIIGALGKGSGADVDTPGEMPTLRQDLVRAAHASLWTEVEAIEVFADLVANYTGCIHPGFFRDTLMSMCGHAGAIAVLTERQRWDGDAMGVREAQLEAALRTVSECTSVVHARSVAQDALRG